MTDEQLNRFFDGITAHNKDMLDRERDAIKRTVEFLGLTLIKEGNKVSMQSLLKLYPEDSSFNDCGTFVDSDVFFKKINDSGIEPELMDYLKEYLTETELTDRLTEDNYMSSIVVQKFIDDYLKREKTKAIEHKIYEKERDLNKLKSFFEKFKAGHHESTFSGYRGNLDNLLVNHIEREEFEFDWDNFLKENK